MKRCFFFIVAAFLLVATGKAQVLKNNNTNGMNQFYYKDTRELVALVKDAAKEVRMKGEAAFDDFRVAGSRWRHGETYIFVLGINGNMIVHPDPQMEGTNQLELKDVNGKPIIRGLLAAATSFPDKSEGWYHYEWPVPGDMLPRWKSSYVQLVTTPSGKSYVVGCGMYNNRMERGFVVDLVKNAVAQVEKDGKAAFEEFHDQAGSFMVKDAYVFVVDTDGVDLVNPGFSFFEGRNVLELKDAYGKHFISEMLKVMQTKGSGWVDYMWPKPGESVPTQKSTYVSKAKIDGKWVLIGCGVYLADAPKAIAKEKKMTAPELMTLVRDAAIVFEKKGENAFPEFRKKGTRWFHNGTYFFAWSPDGFRTFHAANPESEGLYVGDSKDVLGREWGKMILNVAHTRNGEGWIHYMYPEPGNIFPTWKSSFAKLVTFPSGKRYIIGCGIYNMDMDEAFIEDVVNRAASLIEAQGKEAFGQLRDKKGPFVFMDTYVFVSNMDGTELVNAAQPVFEGKSLIDVKDVKGKMVMRDQIDIAKEKGSGWFECYWYRPGDNIPALKKTYIQKVQHGNEVYIVGSGFYAKDKDANNTAAGKSRSAVSAKAAR